MTLEEQLERSILRRSAASVALLALSVYVTPRLGWLAGLLVGALALLAAMITGMATAHLDMLHHRAQEAKQ